MSDVPEAQLRYPPRPVPTEEGEGTARTLSVHGRRVRVGGGTREQGRPHGQLPETAVALPLLLILCLMRSCRGAHKRLREVPSGLPQRLWRGAGAQVPPPPAPDRVPSSGGEVCVFSCWVLSAAASLRDGGPHREQCPAAHSDGVWCVCVCQEEGKIFLHLPEGLVLVCRACAGSGYTQSLCTVSVVQGSRDLYGATVIVFHHLSWWEGGAGTVAC